MRKLRRHLTYANVMSTIAAVFAVGGGVAYAANTVFSSDIVNGEVKTLDVGNNQIRSADVRDASLPDGGLTGADINEASLDRPCPAGMAPVGLDLCYDTTDRGTPTSFPNAIGRCASAGLRLPSIPEAYQASAIWTGNPTWSGDAWQTNVSGGQNTFNAWVYFSPGSFVMQPNWEAGLGMRVRCVTSR